ncbi:urease accessory protein UreH [Bacillus alveayuensis]|uniref:Urease accessory protein UreH n=1 Tax=Aeribacillus alveayuensis TaxID=279215 RepID=A0ABT9VQC8_9BACI|nr:urease accessory protein UreH [Bacillus alveayuensis]
MKNNIHEYLQDPLIVYKHAHLEQDTVVHMERGTTFLYKEIINQGWSDTGQPFLFQELRLKLKVYEENRRKAMVKQQSFRKEPI